MLVRRAQGRLAEQVQQEVQSLLQEALLVAREVVLRNLDILHGLGAQLEGKHTCLWQSRVRAVLSVTSCHPMQSFFVCESCAVLFRLWFSARQISVLYVASNTVLMSCDVSYVL